MRHDPDIPPPYKNLLVVAGITLIALGTGNWIVGASRALPYAQYLAEHPGAVESSENLKSALLRPPDERREERTISRAKLEFYGLVRTGGRLMVVLGAACLLTGMLTLSSWGRALGLPAGARLGGTGKASHL